MADLEGVIDNAVEDSLDVEVPSDDDTGSGDGGVDGGDDSGSGGEGGEGTDGEDTSGSGEGGEDTEGDSEGDKPDPLEKDMGPATRKDGKENRIPYSNVKKIAGNALVRGKGEVLAKIAEAVGVDTTKVTLESLGEVLKGHTAMSPAVTQQLDENKRVASLMEGDPVEFIKLLAKARPDAYSQFLPKAADGGDKEPESALKFPEPDLVLRDGTRTYSVEGLQKLVTEVASQATAAGERRATDRITKEVEPFKRQNESADLNQRMQAQVRAQLADAKTWKGFTENEAAIRQAMVDDGERARKAGTIPRLTLDAAYRQVVVTKMGVDRKAIYAEERKKVLADIKKKGAKKSTSTSSQAGDTTVKGDGPRDMFDVVRAAAEKAGL